LIEIDLVAVKGKTQAGRVYTLPPQQIEEAQFIDLPRAYRTVSLGLKKSDVGYKCASEAVRIASRPRD
jgi:hypothetical protein